MEDGRGSVVEDMFDSKGMVRQGSVADRHTSRTRRGLIYWTGPTGPSPVE